MLSLASLTTEPSPSPLQHVAFYLTVLPSLPWPPYLAPFSKHMALPAPLQLERAGLWFLCMQEDLPVWGGRRMDRQGGLQWMNSAWCLPAAGARLEHGHGQTLFLVCGG